MLPPFSVVIPCFNEAARIGETLRLTLDYLNANAPESELIVVNDGSTDATAAIARERLKDAKIETRLLENFPNRGKGAAVRSGLLAARKPIGLFFDADLSTPLGETPKLGEPIANGEIDIAFGSRALDRGLIGIHQPWRREQAGRAFNLLVRIATESSDSVYPHRASTPSECNSHICHSRPLRHRYTNCRCLPASR